MAAFHLPSKRHRWGAAFRDIYSTERRCVRCGLIKITHHEGEGIPWVEFRRNGERVSVDATPVCEGMS